MTPDFSDVLDRIVNGFIAEIDSGMDVGEATRLALGSIEEHEGSAHLIELLNQRAEYIGVPRSAPTDEKLPWAERDPPGESDLPGVYLAAGHDQLRELIRWAVISKEIIIEHDGADSLVERVRNRVRGAFTSQIVRETMVLGTSFGIDVTPEKIKETIHKMSSEGELTRLPGGKHVPNMYAVTHNEGEHSIVVSGWPVRIMQEKYPDMIIGENGELSLPTSNSEIPKILVDAYISSSCVERAIATTPREFLDLVLSPNEFLPTIDELPNHSRIYHGPKHGHVGERFGQILPEELERVFGYNYGSITYFLIQSAYSQEGSEPPEIWYKQEETWMRKLVSESTVKWMFAAFENLDPTGKFPSMKWTDSRTKLEMLKRKGMDESIYRQFLKTYCWE